MNDVGVGVARTIRTILERRLVRRGTHVLLRERQHQQVQVLHQIFAE